MSYQEVPKAELHMHIDGAIPPEMALKAVKKYCPERENELFRSGADGNLEYNYDDFVGFLNCIDSVAPITLQTPENYEELTYDYLKNSAAEGLVYCEMIVCPGMWYESADYDFADMMAAFERAIDRAEADFGIHARCKATLERGEANNDKNAWAAEQIIENSDHKYLVGLDLANYEQEKDIPPHQHFFDTIKAGQKKELLVSMHAGENAGPINIRHAIDAGAKRAGHITCIMEDADVLALAVKTGFHGEICVSSNVFSAAVGSLEEHRLRDIYNAKVRISFNTDDPTFFRTTIGNEYRIAQENFDFTDLELADVTLMAIEDSFAEDALKDKLKSLVLKQMEQNFEISQDDVIAKRGSANPSDQPKLRAA